VKLHHFRDAVAIAERGSIRAAARHLRLAQPALTRSLGELEREVGALIFERRARGMILTPLGQAFVARATAVLNDVRLARDEVAQLQGAQSGSVAVGLSVAAHLAMLPKTLQPFRARYPDVRLHIIEAQYPTLQSRLMDGSVDFYVGPKAELSLTSELIEEQLFANTRTILARKGHPLSGARRLRDLVNAEWATTSVTLRAEEELGELFTHHGLSAPRLVLCTQSALSLITCLTFSDILAMVPIQWTEFVPTSSVLQSIKLKETLPAPAITLIRRASVPLTPAAMFLADLIRRNIPRAALRP